MRESTIETHLCNRVVALGGEIRKVKWIGRRGAPDRLVMLPHAKPTLVELKRPGKPPEDHQLREHTRLRRYGFEVVVIDSIESVDKFLEEVSSWATQPSLLSSSSSDSVSVGS